MMMELRDIVRKIDDPATNLDESIALYDQGMNLIKACEQILNTAELKITELTQE
jgi:exodeoxyribonuclease VII small subunit